MLLPDREPEILAWSSIFTKFSIDELLWKIENSEFIYCDNPFILSVIPTTSSFKSLYLLTSF